MHEWRESVQQQLSRIAPAVAPAQTSDAGVCEAAPPAAHSTEIPSSTDVSCPDSGFQSTSSQLSATGDSFLSSGTTESLKTVRALSPVRSACTGDETDSADCSLLEQYLSSIRRQEEEAEDVVSDGTETPQTSFHQPPNPTASPGSPPQITGVEPPDGPPREDPAPDPETAL